LAQVFPEGSIFLQKHIRVVSVLFICIWYCAFDWFDKWIH